jgi:hypothetical protein
MPLAIIRPRERVHFVEHALSFADEDGCGYSFPCDAEGNLTNVQPWSWASAWWDTFDNRAIRVYAWANLTRAIAGYHAGELTLKLEHYDHTYVDEAVARCHCGAEIELSGGFWGTSCESCGRSYNASGYELNPPHMWEEREYDDDVHTIAERLHGYDD